jgi:hypothetical protein
MKLGVAFYLVFRHTNLTLRKEMKMQTRDQEITQRMAANAVRPLKEVQVFHTAFEGQAKWVASVAVDHCDNVDEALEYAYRWTQNIHDSWSKKGEQDGNEKVEVLNGDLHAPDYGIPEGQLGHRSTSYMDHMIVHGKIHRVEFCGFKPVDKIKVGIS